MKDSRADILKFWFDETKPVQWFQKNPDFDDTIRTRFAGDYDLAAAGIYDNWMESADGALALVILLDQFPRNMFRGSPQSFATDDKALRVARHALDRHYDRLLAPEKRRFLYLPFEHSEVFEDQERSVALFAAMKKEDPLGYDYAVRHRDVILRFGRFPHRNAVLGRTSTPEETAYLADPSSGF